MSPRSFVLLTRFVPFSVPTVLLILLVTPANAELILSYESGVAASAGVAGSADPNSQGWTLTSGANSFLSGQDSMNGGWRITDGTTAGPAFYSQAITASDVTNMNSQGWVASWTTTVNADAISTAGGGVDNYYSSGSNQNNNAFWVEVAGSYQYVLTFRNNAAGDIFLNDGTSSFQITNTGNNLAQELGAGSKSANYITFQLAYDANTGNAILTDSLGGNHGVVSSSGAGSSNRLVWGATSSAGQGSTTWNQLSLSSVPEPSSLSLFAFCGLGLLFRRRSL